MGLGRGYVEQSLDDSADRVVKIVVELWLQEVQTGFYRSLHIGVGEVAESDAVE